MKKYRCTVQYLGDINDITIKQSKTWRVWLKTQVSMDEQKINGWKIFALNHPVPFMTRTRHTPTNCMVK